MTRRPIVETYEVSLTVPRGEEGFWEIIRALDTAGPWTVWQVYQRSNVIHQVVSAFVRKLRRGGYVELVDQQVNKINPGLPKANVYRLLKKPLFAPRLRGDGSPLPETAQDQLWRAMKMSKGVFTATQLAEVCEDVAISTARNYCFALANAGVLARVEAGRKGSETRYRPVINVGARAPRILAAKMVFDPNSGRIIGSTLAREVSP